MEIIIKKIEFSVRNQPNEAGNNQCFWCGKVIKRYAQRFCPNTIGIDGYFCSLVHFKESVKAQKGL